jgi:hypothetical protein
MSATTPTHSFSQSNDPGFVGAGDLAHDKAQASRRPDALGAGLRQRPTFGSQLLEKLHRRDNVADRDQGNDTKRHFTTQFRLATPLWPDVCTVTFALVLADRPPDDEAEMPTRSVVTSDLTTDGSL